VRADRLRRDFRSGFSLVEVLVASAILIVIVGIVFVMTNQTEQVLQFSSSKIEAFEGARSAFDVITRAVSGATLNTYADYYDASGNRRTAANISTFVPNVYGRCSELEFACGKNLLTSPQQITHSLFFQAPLSYTQSTSYTNLASLLNVVGFYLEFDSDAASRPSFLSSIAPARWRYRLMQLLQPTENFSIYPLPATAGSHNWFTTPLAAATPPVRLLAENIVALVICPRLATDVASPNYPSSLTSNYEYDSSVAWSGNPPQPTNMNQMPPMVRIVLIAVDERSMLRLQGTATSQPNLGFDYANVFQSTANLDQDIATVEAALTSKNLNYRVFQTDVAIRGAKWSL